MPTLFTPHTIDAVFNRIHNLRPGSEPRWGRMNTSEMLQHCRIVTESMIAMKPAPDAPSMKQRIVRSLILNRILKIPQGRPMPEHIAARTQAAGNPEFGAERDALLHAIEAFAAFTGTLNGAHPHFGRMSHADWGRFAWIHLDHHLRQFGV